MVATTRIAGSGRGTVLLLAISGFLLSLGIYEYALRHRSNDCAMTFMFQYPEFQKVSLSAKVKKRFPDYNLFGYGEGGHSVSQSRGVFDGHPVLFLPGNAGSYRQVRSIASVAHQVFQQGVKPFRFDFFALDFDEQKAGIFGPVLQDQVLFAGQAILAIQELYKRNGRSYPVSCILLGHSIGGLVARALLVDPSFEPSCIRLLVTLSAPVTQPVVRFDNDISQFYESTSERWRIERSLPGNESKVGHVMHVSLGGGVNDVLVRSELTRLPEGPDGRDLSLVTTAVPDVWLPVDHLCIVWCKQLMIKLTRMLYDVADFGSDLDKRKDVIHYHLLTRNRGKFFPEYLIPTTISFPFTGSWTYAGDRVFRFSSGGRLLSPVYVVIPLIKGTAVSVILTGEHRHDWIAVCNATTDDNNVTRCDSGLNMSPDTRLLPNRLELPPRAIFKSEVDSLSGAKHMVISLTPQIESPDQKSFQSISLVAERFGARTRESFTVIPSIGWSLLTFWYRQTLLDVPVSRESSFFNVSLSGMSQAWHAYNVKVKTTACYESKVDARPSIVHFYVPWSREDSFSRITNKKNSITDFQIQLNVPRPAGEERSPGLVFHLDPDCGYTVSLSFSLTAAMGQVLRFYYQYLMPFMVAILASAAGIQLLIVHSKSLVQPVDESDEDSDSSIANAFTTSATTDNPLVEYHESLERVLRRRMPVVMMHGLLPVTPVIAVSLLLQVLPTNLLSTSPFKFVYSLRQENLSNLQSVLLFSAISLLAYALVYALVLVTDLILVLVTLSWDKVSPVFVRRRRSITSNSSSSSSSNSSSSQESKSVRLSVTPFILSLILILITVSTTSALGFLMAFLSQAMFLLAVHIRDNEWTKRSGLSVKFTVSRIHETILLLILLMNGATVPHLLSWVSQSCPLFQPFFGQTPDPHIIPCVFLIAGQSFLWQGQGIASNDRTSRTLNSVIRGIGLLTTATCHNLCLVPHLLTLVVLCISLNAGIHCFTRRQESTPRAPHHHQHQE